MVFVVGRRLASWFLGSRVALAVVSLVLLIFVFILLSQKKTGAIMLNMSSQFVHN